MSRPVYVLPEAEADLRDAQFWYDSRAFGLGKCFFSAIDDAVSRIGTSPLHFPVVHDTTRRALVRRFPYALYFRVEAEGVFVIACSHTSRRPSHWQERV